MEKAELDRLMGSPLGVAIYARVSAKKQQDAGNLNRQRERLLSYCVTNKLKVIDVIEDVASGVNENRKVGRVGLEQVLEHMEGSLDIVSGLVELKRFLGPELDV